MTAAKVVAAAEMVVVTMVATCRITGAARPASRILSARRTGRCRCGGECEAEEGWEEQQLRGKVWPMGKCGEVWGREGKGRVGKGKP